MRSPRYGHCCRFSPRTRAATRLGAGLAVGAAIGVATSFAQARLPMPWDALANSASPWLAGGFAGGALQSRRGAAAAAGLSACVLEVAGYYVTAIARGFPASHAYVVFWTICALAGGPLSGVAGWAWRRETGRGGAIGAAFLPGTFIAEAIGSYLLRLQQESAAGLYLAIGAVLLAVAWPARRQGVLAWTGAVTVIGVIVYGPLLAATAGLTAGA
jgi:Family of unknown function (DUF6518)